MSENSLRYKLQQLVVGDYPEDCGSVFVGSEIIKSNAEGADYTRKHTTQLQEKASVPLLIPADIEFGCGYAVAGLTELPSMMGLGATNDLEMAYNYGYITGREARSVGINWAFAPVADLNTNPRNPLVNIRSIGDDPDKAIPMLRQVIKGMQDGGIAACIKHFPGDGVDWRDQHMTTTCNSLSWEEYMQNHGRVFKELADIVDSVMIGHITLPCFQKEKIDGHYPPATLSQELMVDLLRNEMGFRGVIASDHLGMGGFRGWNGSNTYSEVLSFKNGCDVMLWPHASFVDNVISAVENGFVSEKRVDDAFQRVMTLKEKLGLLEHNFITPLTPQDEQFIREETKRMYEKSIVLECDNNQQLPLDRTAKKIAIVRVGTSDNTDICIQTAKSAFEKRGAEVTVHNSTFFGNYQQFASSYDKIFYMLFAQPHRPMGPVDFKGDDPMSVWACLTYGIEKTVIASFGSPYFKTQYFERANTFINAYSPDPAAVEATVAAMYGEAGFQGISPVKL